MYLLDKLLGDNIAGSPKGGTGRDADVVLCRMVSGVDTGLIMQGGCREQYRAGDNIIKHWL